MPVEPPEVPELPEPLVLPDPLALPEPLVLPDPLVLPEPLVLPDALVLPDPLEVPEPLMPPGSVDPLVALVVEVPDCPALAPLLPPHAVIANAIAATSNPLRTNNVFIMYPCSSGPTPSAHARLCAQGAIHMPPGA